MRGISKAFQGVQALADVDFEVRASEVHALMGENGAGKSTLIKVLTGVHPLDGGTIEFAGSTICPRSPHQAEWAGISTVYQEVNLIPTLSIADNIALGRQETRFGLIRWSKVKDRAKRALARLGLELDTGQMLGTCSIAVQQMVAIARALDVQAKLLILDEPTSSLDEREVAFLFEVMRRLRGQGMAIVFVTHFLDQVYAISDRITVLRNGKLVGQFETAELPRLKLVGAMLGREFETVQALERAKSLSSGGPEVRTAFLEARGIGKRGVVSPLDIDVAAGEVLGLAGLLGSGRTETARMLFGMEVPDTGTLRIDGRLAVIRSPRHAMRSGFAFCSEDRKAEGIIPRLSVRENLILAMQASRGPMKLLPRGEQEALCEHYIRALGIKTPGPETPIAHLSGGNQQKVLLARWLVVQPKLLILDEPTRGIDVGAKAEIEKLIESLRAKGMAIIFISSDLEEVVRTCQRVTVLRDRRKIGELRGDDVKEDRIMHVIAEPDRGGAGT